MSQLQKLSRILFTFSLVALAFAVSAQPPKKKDEDHEGMQSDPKAVEVLKASQAKVNSLKQMTVNFTQTLSFNGKETSSKPVKGMMKLKGEKFMVELEDVKIYCDGKTQWSYLPKEKEVTISNYDKKEGFSPSQMFKISQKDTKSRYDNLETDGGKSLHKLSLFPRDNDADYYKIELWVNDADKMPQKIKFFSRKQSTTTFVVNKMDTATAIEDAAFAIDPKSLGAEVIDNR